MRMLPASLLFAILGGTAIAAAAQKHYRDLDYPPLEDIEIPDVERTELPNGLVVYLLEDPALPKVEGFVLVRSGDRLEPADRVGLASLAGQVMRTGGTTTRPGEEIDRLLENVGASVETGIGTTSGSASLFALSDDFPLVLEILADLLQNPAFPEDKIELAKVQERTAIDRRNDDVGSIASREFRKLLYGPENPYARTTEYDTIARITREDLVAFHGEYFHPNRTILGLWGDFRAGEARSLVERHFGAWKRSDEPLPPIPEAPAPGPGSLAFIEKDDVNQTNIRMGHLDGRRDDEDYHALELMGEVLGGGFSSRLFRRIRTELGLAYAVSASWNAGWDYAGTFSILCNTKSESTVRAIREIQDEVRRMTEEPVSEEELRVAKEGIINSFVFNFDTTGEIVRRLMTYEYYGYPRDFLETYKESIEKVTAEDILRAARKHLRPEELTILAVGREEDFDEPLSTLGEVQTIDITIPEPETSAAPRPPVSQESGERGARALSRAVEAAGGNAALSGVGDFQVELKGRLSAPQGEVPVRNRVFFSAPDKYREEAELPFGRIVAVWNGEEGWVETPGGVETLDAEGLDRIRKSFHRNYLGLLWKAARGDVVARHLESTTLGGGSVETLLLEVDGDSIQAFVESETGRLRRISFEGRSLTGAPVTEERVFFDFQDHGGLSLPTRTTVYHDGHPAGEGSISAYRINEGIPPEMFERNDSPGGEERGGGR